MLRAFLFSLLALSVATGTLLSAPRGVQKGKNQKNQNSQVIRGTIKSIGVQSGSLVITQKNKKQSTDREVTINDQTLTTIGNKKAGSNKLNGKAGLKLLEGHEGEQIVVMMSQDSKVLRIVLREKQKIQK